VIPFPSLVAIWGPASSIGFQIACRVIDVTTHGETMEKDGGQGCDMRETRGKHAPGTPDAENHWLEAPG